MAKRGIDIGKLISVFQEMAPLEFAEGWDNVGLLVDLADRSREISAIRLCNDFTRREVQAVLSDKGADEAVCVVAYHPPIFSSMKRVTVGNRAQEMLLACVANRVAVFSPHTAWDAVEGGVCDWLVDSLGAGRKHSIIPPKSDDEKCAGMGRYVALAEPVPLTDLVERVKTHLAIPHVRVALPDGRSMSDPVSSLAACAGSGADVLAASKVHADVWLTGEMSHHSVLDATHNGSVVILCEHSNTERGYLTHFANALSSKISDHCVSISILTSDRDPLHVI